MKVLILSTHDGHREGLYINGELSAEGHSIDLKDRMFLLKKSEEFGFSSSDIIHKVLEDVDEDYMYANGKFPQNLNDLGGNYLPSEPKIPGWKEIALKRMTEGVFRDELLYTQNQLLKLPIEEQPSKMQIKEFIIDCMEKEFDNVFINWNDFLSDDLPF